MQLVRDVLDTAVLDRNRREIGRVDGIALAIENGEVAVRTLDVGMAVVGYRLHPAAGRLVEAVAWWLRSEPAVTLRIPFADVDEIDREITLKRTLAELRADDRPAAPQHDLRLERLLGREVLAGNNHRIGRLEEFRARRDRGRCTISVYVIGAAGSMERLGLGVRLLLGLKLSGYLATGDQLDLTNPQRPRLTCSVSELEEL